MLEKYYQYCLWKILSIQWEDRWTNLSVLSQATHAQVATVSVNAGLALLAIFRCTDKAIIENNHP